MMTIAKLQRILAFLAKRTGHLPHGFLESSTGGELQFTFQCQLMREQHDELIYLGFVYVDNSYIYRPYRKNR